MVYLASVRAGNFGVQLPGGDDGVVVVVVVVVVLAADDGYTVIRDVSVDGVVGVVVDCCW